MTLVQYTTIKIEENNEPLIDLAKFDFILEPKYFHQGLSKDSKLFLREGVAQKLLKVQNNLGNLNLKIWDAYRSRSVQNNIYQKYWTELKTAHPNWDQKKLELEVGKFIAPPYQKDRIPPHATGGAVDLTLVDKDGNNLEMGTEFDHFGLESESFYYEIYQNKPKTTQNRRILRQAMQSEGFTLDQEEWWHFDWGNQIWALKSNAPNAFYGEI